MIFGNETYDKGENYIETCNIASVEEFIFFIASIQATIFMPSAYAEKKL